MNQLARRLLFGIVGAFFWVSSVHAQSHRRAPATYPQAGIPDQKEGARILEQSRNIGLAGAYYLEFELRFLPKKGPETRMSGRWFGDRNITGPITRVELTRPDGVVEILIVQSGPNPTVWQADVGSRFTLVAGDAVAQPLAGTTVSAADLQTPFMYWTAFAYEDLQRFRGRPTHVFLLYPPESQASRYPGVGGVRVFIDTEFDAISQAQWVDPDGNPLKTITIIDVVKVGGQYIVKSFEVRDEATRDKTRFTVKAAALNYDAPGELFESTGIAAPATIQIPRTSINRVE